MATTTTSHGRRHRAWSKILNMCRNSMTRRRQLDRITGLPTRIPRRHVLGELGGLFITRLGIGRTRGAEHDYLGDHVVTRDALRLVICTGHPIRRRLVRRTLINRRPENPIRPPIRRVESPIDGSLPSLFGREHARQLPSPEPQCGLRGLAYHANIGS